MNKFNTMYMIFGNKSQNYFNDHLCQLISIMVENRAFCFLAVS